MAVDAVSFSGHESFPLRQTWLTKGAGRCAENPGIFTSEDAMAVLGVGKNMVRAIRHWCLVAGILERRPSKGRRSRTLAPSLLAERLFLHKKPWDPYLEDVGTLWLIHWRIATNGRLATTWYYAFGKLNRPDFTKGLLEKRLLELARQTPGTRATVNTIRRDIDVFLRTYVRSPRRKKGEPLEDSLDCPLSELRLIIRAGEPDGYAFDRGPKPTLPDEVFLYAMAQFAERRGNAQTIAFEDLAYAEGSPGRAFKLDEFSLGERLERLASVSKGACQFSETAGLKQMVFARRVDPIRALEAYYGTSVALAGAGQ